MAEHGVSGDEVARSIEPGSVPSGERGPIEDRIRQAMATKPTSPEPGAASGRGLDKLAQGPVSDKPVTDGLSLGPGTNPAPNTGLQSSERVDTLRLIAKESRSPRLRALARGLLRADAKNLDS